MEKHAPFTVDGKKVLQLGVVGVLDILGLQHMIRGCKTRDAAMSLMGDIDSLLSTFRSWPYDEGSEPEDFEQLNGVAVTFSDTLVHGVPMDERSCGESTMGTAIDRISRCLLMFAMQGYFCRGGLSIGWIHISSHLFFGNALIEAHTLDKHGDPPRVVLSSKMRKFAERFSSFYSEPAASPHAKYLMLDKEINQVFVDYLSAANYREGGYDWKMVACHADAIQSNLSRFAGNPNILRKYEWLAAYHNYHVLNHLYWYDENYPPKGSKEAYLIDSRSVDAKRFSAFIEGNRYAMTTKLRMPGMCDDLLSELD